MAERRWRWAGPWAVLGAWALMGLLLWYGLRTAHLSVLAVLGWSCLFAVGQFVRAPTPSGGRLTLTSAVATALPLVIRRGGVLDAGGVVAVLGLGLLLSWLVRWGTGEPAGEASGYVIRRIVGLTAFVGLFMVLDSSVRELLSEASREVRSFGILLALTVTGVVWFMIDTFLEAIRARTTVEGSWQFRWRLNLSDWMVALTLFATGALFGFTWPRIELWALPVAVLPYVFSHLAFVRYFDTRRTYRQTIRALSRLPEVAGLSAEGHADRVADLAVALARDVGMGPDEVTELEYAALLHDIGRITLNEPTILKAGFTDEDVARWGSEIVAEAAYLGRVATLVREQHHPYRRPGEERDPGLPLASKIIRVASAFDHATTDLGFSELEALEVLHRGAAYDFDPTVVQSLRKVLEQRRDEGQY